MFGAENNVIVEASFFTLISGDPMLEQETSSFGQIPRNLSRDEIPLNESTNC